MPNGEQDLRRETAAALRDVAEYVEARAPRWFIAQALKIVLLAQKLRGVKIADAEGEIVAVFSRPRRRGVVTSLPERRELLEPRPLFLTEKSHRG